MFMDCVQLEVQVTVVPSGSNEGWWVDGLRAVGQRGTVGQGMLGLYR